jgi:diadenosine tetraphosphatase ApaH/serine/threonine PP2A family protein phosphatase
MEDAEDNFEFFTEKACLLGHTHRPYIVYKAESGDAILSKDTEVKLESQYRYLVNIGSVGQPRDGDPRSCYLIYDSEEESIRLKRVQYDVKTTQKVMEKIGLPEYLIDRLAVGR